MSDPLFYLHNILKLCHILAMAIWFGAGLGIAGDIRRTLARGKPHTDLLGGRAIRTLDLMAIAGALTLATGVGLFLWFPGGVAALPPRFHAGIAIAFISYALLMVVMRPAASRMESTIARADGNEIQAMAKRFSMTTGIDHTLKLIVIILMVIPIGGR